jgi:hypothetical protein
MSPAALLVGLSAAITPVAVSEAWLYGEWCEAGGGERMLAEATGVGFNEHTICEWVAGPPGGGDVNTDISCANVYAGDGKTVRTGAKLVKLRVERIDDASIAVRIDDAPPAVFRRCDE